jgi:multicomponent Na+:H+ antiporter subunit C
MNHLSYAVAAWLFLIGLYGVVSSRNLIHLVLCLGVIQSSTYLVLLSIGYRAGRPAPIYADIPPGTPAVDPLVQALMLTDIVVEVTVVALLLAIAVQVHKCQGSLNPDRLRNISG